MVPRRAVRAEPTSLRRTWTGVLPLLATTLILTGTAKPSVGRSGAISPRARWRGSEELFLGDTGGLRPTEGCLSGISTYAPFPTLLSGRAGAEVATVAREFNARRDGVAPSELSVLAGLALAAGRTQEATSALKRAVGHLPESAAFLSDLAAVALEEGRRTGDPQSYLDAPSRGRYRGGRPRRQRRARPRVGSLTLVMFRD